MGLTQRPLVALRTPAKRHPSKTDKIGVLDDLFTTEAHESALNKLPMFFPDTPETERHVIVGRTEDALEGTIDRLRFAQTAID